jgi:capsid protein
MKLFVPPKSLSERLPTVRWFWDGMEHVDPNKEAKAADARIKSRVSNLAIECAKAGLDWEDVLLQAAREQRRMRELGLLPVSSSDNTDESEDEDEERKTDEPDARTDADSVHRRKKRTGQS